MSVRVCPEVVVVGSTRLAVGPCDQCWGHLLDSVNAVLRVDSPGEVVRDSQVGLDVAYPALSQVFADSVGGGRVIVTLRALGFGVAEQSQR